MKFNLCYFGPEWIFNLRRDFFLTLKYGLESLGHQVHLAGAHLEPQMMNLLVGAYFLPAERMAAIRRSGVPYAVVNTEIVKNDLLNFNPNKTDLKNGYLPLIRGGSFSWDVVPQNIPELSERYAIRSHLLRLAYHEKLVEIENRETPDLDYYFFGFISDRRKRMLIELKDAGFVGLADNSCPFFVRNDRIGRARVQINIRQEARYVHVNAFRICYLANNRTAILSEAEDDPTDYLQYAQVADKRNFAQGVAELLAGDKWKTLRERSFESYRRIELRTVLAELLETSFASAE